MKKLILLTAILLTSAGVYALTLESVPSFFGPLSLSPFLQSWKGSLETNAAAIDTTTSSLSGTVSSNSSAILLNASNIVVNAGNITTVSQRVTNITALFDTNEVVVATTHTPTSVGQLLVGATNLYVSVGLTTNSWLQIK